jgi:chaperone BCS1
MTDLLQFLGTQLQNNQFFQGGLIMGIAMAIWAYVRGWPATIGGWIVYHMTVELDIPDTDPAFRWVNEWLAAHHYSKRRARRLTVSSIKADKDNFNDRQERVVVLAPAPGRHWLWHRRRLLILKRDRNTQTDQGNGGRRRPFMETFNIRVLGRNRAPALRLIEEAHAFAQPAQDELELHQVDCQGYWDLLARRKTRSADSVILAGGIERVLADVQNFVDSREWYTQRGVPYRRGYLLHGLPGNGKTSLILAVASHFRYNLGYVNMADIQFDDGALIRSLAHTPPHTLVVIEDIDCVFRKRDTEVGGVTFSGFLNALDGIASPEGHLLMMTTNHKELLDPALIRPGRVDVDIEFHNATAEQASAMFRRFYPDTPGATVFGQNIPTDVSMAALQGHLVGHKNDPDAAIATLSTLRTPKSK